MDALKPVTDPAILAQLNGDSGGLKPVTDPAILAQLNGTAPTGPQPSFIDKVVGSPLGRIVHDVGVQGVEGAANLATMVPLLNSAKPGVDLVTNAVEGAYNNSLARNRNTPGYAQARQAADASQQLRGGSGFKDQMFSQFLPATAGLAGYLGGVDSSNAMADAQSEAQHQYSAQHPILSTAANALGSFAMAAPERGVPAAAPEFKPAIKPGAQAAHEAGYVLPPRMISDSPGVLADTGAAWSGKVKTAQAASAANQEVTNQLAAKALGLPGDATITDKVLQGIRDDAGKAYSAIPKTMPVTAKDADFVTAIKSLGDKSTEAAAAFPDLMGNSEIDKIVESMAGETAPAEFSTQAGMDLVRKLRANANANFRAIGAPEKIDLAFAQRQAADALDGLIERNLAQRGAPELATQYQSARQLIAKSHDVEAATNTITGNVSARKLAQLSARGRPFTGELATIADTAAAFPKAMQSESAFGGVEPLSVLDVGAAVAAAPHNPSVVGAVLGRPVARSMLLSGPAQRAMVNSAMTKNAALASELAPIVNPGATAIPLNVALSRLLRSQAATQ